MSFGVGALVAGFALGFVGSVPVAGPISLIVVDSTLQNRPRKGLMVAIGAALAESAYAALAFWGLTRIFGKYPELLPLSRVLAGAVLLLVGAYFAVRRFRSRGSRKTSEHAGRHVALGFTMTLFNPTLIATWAAAIAALHALVQTRYAPSDTLPFAMGSCLGIITWFWLLIRIICRIKNHVGLKLLEHVVRAMGGALFLAGTYMTLHTLTAR